MKAREFRELQVGGKKVEADHFRRVNHTRIVIDAINKAEAELPEREFHVMLDELASDIVSRQSFSDIDDDMEDDD
ncbi:MAG: hypothetical protein HS101_16020 [Planctomycetia bacterium]|jgi:hypothetical protein|nr:hypothetical protein [Planctomycetia bacterium]MCC7315146.1 hypothetical protein [Planctomycetota bacterium]OQY96247.1 MAG: hypothetical protein B6D36_19685 [Planctomycetes bacterium UTPLA1]